MFLILQGSAILWLLASLPGSVSAPSQHLCGSNLVDTLYLLCGPRGFYSNRTKRDLASLLVLLSNLVDDGRAEDDSLKEVMKRGIVEQCCHTPCTIYHLENYCS